MKGRLQDRQSAIDEISFKGDAAVPSAIAGWPAEVREVSYLSSADDTWQPTLFYAPKSDKAVPLLVALHTWGGDYKQAEPAYAKWCIAKGWGMVHPNFRGANNKREATGSELVIQDILSAVEYAKKTTSIDTTRIYLVGVSGGGYAAMLMAGRAPKVWAGVSAWCGIYDLSAWHQETSTRKLDYAAQIAKSTGGAPGVSAEVDAQYRARSASTWIDGAKNVPIDLNAGIFDGHKGSVPVSHSLLAFNALAAPAARIAAADIAFITEKSAIPAALKKEIDDPWYARGQALLRQKSGNTRITVFDGGHEIIHEAALAWLEQQQQGKPPVWEIKTAINVNLKNFSTEAGK